MNIIFCVLLSSLIGFSIAEWKDRNKDHHSRYSVAFDKLRGDVYHAQNAVGWLKEKTNGFSRKVFDHYTMLGTRHKRDGQSMNELSVNNDLIKAARALNEVSRTLVRSVVDLALAVDGLEDLANDTDGTDKPTRTPMTSEGETDTEVPCLSVKDCPLSILSQLMDYIAQFTGQLDDSVQDLSGEIVGLNDLLHPKSATATLLPNYTATTTQTPKISHNESHSESLDEWFNVLNDRVIRLTRSAGELANTIEKLAPLIPNLKPCDDKPCDPDQNVDSETLELVAQSLVETTTTLTASADELNNVVELVINLAEGRA